MEDAVDPRSVPNANTLKLTHRNLNATPVTNMGFDMPPFMDEFDALLTKIVNIPSRKHSKEDYTNIFCGQVKSYLNRLFEHEPATEADKVSKSLTCNYDKDIAALKMISDQLKLTLSLLTPGFTTLGVTPTKGGSRQRSRRPNKKVKRSRRRQTSRR